MGEVSGAKSKKCVNYFHCIDKHGHFRYNPINMATRGKFIVFEGTDGSGKSTQIKMLKEYLERKGIPVFCTHEPTESPFGALVHACMKGSIETNEHTIAVLFAADRIDHIQNPETGMLKKLEEGCTVLCDRYYFSSFAYNGGLVPLEWVEELNRPAMELLRPDLVIFLDVTPEESMKRVGRREERERYETLERQQKTREKFFSVFESYRGRENIAVIASEGEKERTQENVRKVVDALFGR